jgi:hypothetical protein
VKRAIAKVTTLLVCLSVGPLALAQLGNNTAVLNPNTAEAAALRGLPHVSETLSKAIVAGRPWLTTSAFNDALAKSLSDPRRSGRSCTAGCSCRST